MNEKMKQKITDLINEHGFLPDEDFYNFAQIVINECLNVIHTHKQCPDGCHGSHEAGFQLGCNKSIEHIKEHFGIK